jgi:RimJ/RimL family protein N-acetyltransferase
MVLDPERDAKSLHTMLADPATYTFSNARPTGDVVESKERLAHELAGNGGWTWAITLLPRSEAIGTIGIFYDQGTSIRGLDWKLTRQHWGRGLMTEAARAVVPHLLQQPHITGLEAWIDVQNARSLGVARHAGLAEVARLNRVYDDRVAQQVVMARAADPQEAPVTLAVRPVLPVDDIGATADLLVSILGLHLAFDYGEPTSFARLSVRPWTGSQGIDLQASNGPISPVTVTVDAGILADVVHERARSAGLEIIRPPTDQPWPSRECAFALSEGHRIRVSGPIRPPGQVS